MALTTKKTTQTPHLRKKNRKQPNLCSYLVHYTYIQINSISNTNFLSVVNLSLQSCTTSFLVCQQQSAWGLAALRVAGWTVLCSTVHPDGLCSTGCCANWKSYLTALGEMMQLNFVSWLHSCVHTGISHHFSSLAVWKKNPLVGSQFVLIKTKQKVFHFNNLYSDYRCIPFWSLEGDRGSISAIYNCFENVSLYRFEPWSI